METVVTDIVFLISEWLSDLDAVRFFMCNRWLWSHRKNHQYRDWHDSHVVRRTSYYHALTRIVLTRYPDILPKACRHIRFSDEVMSCYVDFARPDMQNLQSIELMQNFYAITLPPNLQNFTIQHYNPHIPIQIGAEIKTLKCEYYFYNQMRDALPLLYELEIYAIENRNYHGTYVSEPYTFGEGITHITIRHSGYSRIREMFIYDIVLPVKLQHFTVSDVHCNLSESQHLPHLTLYQNDTNISVRNIQTAFPALQRYQGPYRRDLSVLAHLTQLTITNYTQSFNETGLRLAHVEKLHIKIFIGDLDLDLLPALVELRVDKLQGLVLNLESSQLKRLRIGHITPAIMTTLPKGLTHLKIKSACEMNFAAWPTNLQQLRVSAIGAIPALPSGLHKLRLAYDYDEHRALRFPAGLQSLDLTAKFMANLVTRRLGYLQHLTLRKVASIPKFQKFLPEDIVSIRCYDCELSRDVFSGFENRIIFE